MMANIAARLSSCFGAGSSRTEGRTAHTTSAGIMVPRVVFLVCALGLLLFGMVMIYSASSIVGSDELPWNESTGWRPRAVKYSVGRRPQVMSSQLTPRFSRFSISR